MNFWKKLKWIGTVIFVIVLIVASISSLGTENDEEEVAPIPIAPTSKFNF